MGIFFALLSSTFFGLYIIPRKLSKVSSIDFSLHFFNNSSSRELSHIN